MDNADYFCDNPACVLHVQPGSPGVTGTGEWALLPNGCMYARMWVNDRFLCHVCALYPDRSLTGDAIVHQSNSS